MPEYNPRAFIFIFCLDLVENGFGELMGSAMGLWNHAGNKMGVCLCLPIKILFLFFSFLRPISPLSYDNYSFLNAPNARQCVDPKLDFSASYFLDAILC